MRAVEEVVEDASEDRPAGPRAPEDGSGLAPIDAMREVLAITLDFDGPSCLVCGFDGGVNGVFVASHDVLPLGTVVTAVVCLPDGTRFESSAEVRFVRVARDDEPDSEGFLNDGEDGHWPGFGVVFTGLPQDAREAVEAFSAIRPPLFYPD